MVTTSAYGTGVGCRPAATRPAKCAMSTTRYAPTSSAIARKRSKSRTRGYADQPARIIFGRRSCAIRSTSSMSIRLGLAIDVVGDDVVQPARDVDPHPVGEVAAVGELEPHHRCRRARSSAW